MKPQEIPTIEALEDKVVITITLEQLIHVIEQRVDIEYRVKKPYSLLKAFKRNLENYAESNATEEGISELQELFDRIVDEIYTNEEDIILTEEDE